MGDVANKDEAFKCLDIARTALKAGEHARAEKFAAKALRLYRCSQTESMVLQVQVYMSERMHSASGEEPAKPTPSANGSTHSQRHEQHECSSAQHHSSRQHQQQQSHAHAHNSSSSRQQQGHSGSSHRQQQHQSSGQRQHPRGMGGSEGLRHRGSSAAAAAAPEPPVQEDPSVTPEQRKLVQQILVAKSYYEVMGVSRDASDVDIKSAYKKLALRLHPDKNKAHKADEAFKLLSRAFSCLSTPDKRAYYDRTGYESGAAAQAAAASTRRSHNSSGMGNGSFFYTGADEFDPEEIFNAFFGAGAFHPHASRVFRSQFGGFPGAGYAQQQQRQQRPPSREEQQRAQLLGLFQVLPILLIVLVTFFSTQTEPVYSLAQDAKYVHQMHTSRLGVSFWVKDKVEFNKAYPIGNYKRLEVERHVETDVYERVYQRCQNERMAQHRAFTWGNRESARKMELASCQELSRLHERMGSHRPAGVVR